MRQNRREMRNMGPRKGFPVWLVIVVFLVVLGAISFGVATVWQRVQDGSDPAEKVEQVDPKEEIEPKKEEEILEDVEEISPITREVDTIYSRRAEFDAAVMETEEAKGNDYFDDAIFFGDSISTGIGPYLEAILPEIAVVAQTGLGVHNASTSEVIPVNGERKTMLVAAMELYGPRKKVYIMLGSNGLDADKEAFIQGYREFLEKVKAQYPDAVIYLQSMTPVTGTEDQQREYPSLNNEKITDYNMAVMKLAQEENVYYVDVAVAFLNEDGILPADASPDGVHFPGEYYYKWFDYLKKHTVE